MAVAALHANPTSLLNDANYLGFLFESMVVRDVRVYAPPGSRLCQYRDNTGREIDLIVQTPEGAWAGFEDQDRNQ